MALQGRKNSRKNRHDGGDLTKFGPSQLPSQWTRTDIKAGGMVAASLWNRGCPWSPRLIFCTRKYFWISEACTKFQRWTPGTSTCKHIKNCCLRPLDEAKNVRRFVNWDFSLTFLRGGREACLGAFDRSRGPAPAAATQSNGLREGRHFGAAHRTFSTW